MISKLKDDLKDDLKVAFLLSCIIIAFPNKSNIFFFSNYFSYFRHVNFKSKSLKIALFTDF